jgi:hypothetical protein
VSGADALASRLEELRRYAEYAVAQLAVLEAGELDAFFELAALRDELAAELDAAPQLAPLLRGHAEGALEERLAPIRLALAHAAEADVQIQEHLRRLRDDARASLYPAADRSPASRAYLDAVPQGTRLDVRS